MCGPTLPFAPTKTYNPISVDLREKRREKKKQISLSLTLSLSIRFLTFLFIISFLSFFLFLFYFLFLFLNSFIAFYCIINHMDYCEPHIQVHHMALAMCHSLWVPCGIPLVMSCVIRHSTPQKTCNSYCLRIRRNLMW